MKTRSFRKQLTIILAIVVLLQSLSFAASLWFANVFNRLDAQSFRMFENTVNSRTQNINRNLLALIEDLAVEANMLSQKLSRIIEINGKTAADYTTDDAAFSACHQIISDGMIELLQKSYITGGFAFFNASGLPSAQANDRSGIYIRNTAPELAISNKSKFQLLFGSTDIVKQHGLTLAEIWTYDYRFEDFESSNADFYTKPFEAAKQNPGKRIQNYGFWSKPFYPFDDGLQVVCYSVPLINTNGEVLGVLGIELNINFLARQYLPSQDLVYSSSFYSFVNMANNEISMEWFVPGGPYAQRNLILGTDNLVLKEEKASDSVFLTRLPQMGDSYCVLKPLALYDNSSPFAQNNVWLAAFVPKNVLHESSAQVKTLLLIIIFSTAIISLIIVVLISFLTTRKISGLSAHVKNLKPADNLTIRRTGFKEIDDLSLALEGFNKSVISTSQTTAKIMALTRLPIGGFEISYDPPYVFLTEYVRSILGIEKSRKISCEEWNNYYLTLTETPDIGNENVYIFSPMNTDRERYIRIIVDNTQTGYVGIVQDISDEIEENLRLLRELDFDRLTQLYNHDAFKREAENMIKSSPDKIGAMIFADLDNLKFINDHYGHGMGDRLIIEAAELYRSFEEFGAIAARISGDEFAVFLHGFSNKKKLRKLINERFEYNTRAVLNIGKDRYEKIRSSAGVAWYPEDSENVSELLKLSDYAMYEAKHNNKGTIQEFSRESYARNIYIVENQENLNTLLEEEKIHFAYQPIVDLHTGEIYAYEALMRSLMEDFRSPAEILSVAASQGKMPQLEWLVMKKSHALISENIERLEGRRIFVNSIPGIQLKREQMAQLNEKYPGITNKIVIEITEESAVSIANFRHKVNDLRNAGYRLAIDDFGTGYSNELRIIAANPDIVKIDMSIVQGIHNNKDLRHIAENVISFCHSKGIKTVAEGVEEKEDLLEVMRLGADYVQGYFVARPNFEFVEIEPKMKELIVKANLPKKNEEETF